MSTGTLPAEPLVRHTADAQPVTGTMTQLRTAAPFLRAVLLAIVVVVLIMVGLPTVLAAASAV